MAAAEDFAECLPEIRIELGKRGGEDLLHVDRELFDDLVQLLLRFFEVVLLLAHKSIPFEHLPVFLDRIQIDVSSARICVRRFFAAPLRRAHLPAALRPRPQARASAHSFPTFCPRSVLPRFSAGRRGFPGAPPRARGSKISSFLPCASRSTRARSPSTRSCWFICAAICSFKRAVTVPVSSRVASACASSSVKRAISAQILRSCPPCQIRPRPVQP